MRIKIEEAISLQNARQVLKNEKNERPSHYKCITKSNLGRIIYPNQKGASAVVSMHKLCKGAQIKPDVMVTICKETGTDPNFLLGWPSDHDKDYENLVSNKKG